jgi:hypothetical protein
MAEPFDPYHKWLGIAPKDQPPHHYRLLGIDPFEDDRDVIDAAANRVMSYLKDLAAGDDDAYSQEIMNEVMQARICLLNPKRKTAYDSELRAKVITKKPPPPRAAQTTATAASATPPSSPSPVPVVATSPTSARRRRPSWKVTAAASTVGLLAAAVLIALVFSLSGGQSDDGQLAKSRSETSDSAQTESTDHLEPMQVVPVDPKMSVQPFKDAASGKSPSSEPSEDSHGEDATGPASTDPDSITEPSGPSKTEGADSESSPNGEPSVTAPVIKPAGAPVAVKPVVFPTPVPLPSVEDQDRATRLVREVFGKEIAGATTGQNRIAVARRMLQAAGDASEKATTRFVLLVEAHKLAIAAEDTTLVNEITDCMVRDFTIEEPEANASVLDTKGTILEELSDRAKTPEDLAAVAESALALADQAAGDDRTELAEKMASMALSTARRAGDDELVRKATLRLVELR